MLCRQSKKVSQTQNFQNQLTNTQHPVISTCRQLKSQPRQSIWGFSSAGRALAWHARGHRFDPGNLHQNKSAWQFCRALFVLYRVQAAHRQGGLFYICPQPGILKCIEKVKAIPHNSKCRYGERGAADAKPKAQIILDAAKVGAASGGSEPSRGQRSQSARAFAPKHDAGITRHYRAFLPARMPCRSCRSGA